MGSQLILLVVSKDRDGIKRFFEWNPFPVPDIAVVPVVNRGTVSIPQLANTALSLDLGYDAVGVCHADTRYSIIALERFKDTALTGKVCGMVGRHLQGGYIWSKDVTRPVEVSTLDCCSVFFRRDSGLRFDEETFDGFHCYVEDLSLQAHAKGIPVVVPPAKASHLEESTRNPEWQADYKIYRKRLAIKWAGTVFETT